MRLEELDCINENININNYIEFRDYVKENMCSKDWLGDFSKENLLDMLNNNSKIWIYYLNDDPVCSMMLIPSNKKDLSKFELDLDYKEVVDYGPMFVNPKYVGNGLQFQMLKELDKYCLSLGYKYAISTIHPDNVYSINNILKDKFVNIDEKNFTRGIRNIYLKCLKKNCIQKILTIVIKDNKYLLLKGSEKDPQFHKSFWYVITGAFEKCDNSIKDTVRRELKEETNLELKETYRLPFTFEYESLGKHCLEYMFISYVDDSHKVKLNEESIDYKWCNLDEFIELINWFDNKETLKQILEKYI